MKRSVAKSRGRPRQPVLDEQQMRERIVAAARDLFLRQGVDAVSMRNIASAVGCSAMWLYRYFDSKQAILWQVWDMFLLELSQKLARVSATSPRAQLEQLGLVWLDYWLQYPERFLIVFLQKDLQPDATRDYVEGFNIVARFELFTRTAEQALIQGELGGADASTIAEGLLCVLQGVALNVITIAGYPWHNAAALGRLTVQSYLAGLTPRVGVPATPPPAL